MDRDEKDIVNKALKGNPTKRHTAQKQIRFIDDRQFLHDLKTLYPAATSVIIVNLNEQDMDGSPKLTVKKLKSVHCSISSWGSSSHVTAHWSILLAVLDGENVSVKVSQMSIGDCFV